MSDGRATFGSVTIAVKKKENKIARSNCSNRFICNREREQQRVELYPLFLVRFYDRHIHNRETAKDNFPLVYLHEKKKRKRKRNERKEKRDNTKRKPNERQTFYKLNMCRITDG